MKYNLYSKDSITLSSVFLTPLVGGILMSANLREIGKGKFSMVVIIVSIIWTVLMRAILSPIISNDIIALFASNALGAALFNLLLWNYFFSGIDEYQKRSPVKVVVIATAIFAVLLILQLIVARST